MLIINFIIRFLILSPVCIIMIQNVFNIYSPDIPNYYSDYVNHNNSYEFGYEILVSLSRDIFGLSFEEFWISYMILQAGLMAIIFNRYILLLVAMPILLSLSSFYFGIQIRYSLFSLLFILSIKYLPSYTYISTFVFHTGSIFSIFGRLMYDLYSFKFKSLFEFNFISICFILIASGLSVITSNIASMVLSEFVRFEYYQEEIMGNKSIISTLYIYISLLLILYGNKHFEGESKKIIETGIVVLYLVVVTVSMISLSGRLFLVYLVISPIIAHAFILSKKTRTIGFTLLLMSVVKLISESTYLFEAIL
ncbi:EpsG family protein [Vibrio cyclitrophicus]